MKMKRILAIALTVCMVLAAMPGASALARDVKPITPEVVGSTELITPISKFSDLKSDAWYCDGINYCLKAGLMDGVGGGKFAPDAIASRAMIVTMLYRLEGEPAFMNDNVFSDVKAGSYYEKAVVWASGKGIVKGYGATFGPDDPVTREQLAAILFNYAKYKEYDVSVGEDTNVLSYDDAFDVSEWAMSAIQWAFGAGVLTGEPVTNNAGSGLGMLIRPGDGAKRSEVAAMFRRACKAFGMDVGEPVIGEVAGGWTANGEFGEFEMPADALEAFEAGTQKLLGTKYVPVAYLGSQVVAGTNYAYLCKGTYVTAEPVTKLFVMKIYKALDGTVKVLDVIPAADCISNADANHETLAGGWNVSGAVGGELSENVKTAFDKAMAGLMGVKYTPVACLASQVVAGSNYAVLCKATTVTAEPTDSLAVVVIYAGVDGSTQVKSVSAFEL